MLPYIACRAVTRRFLTGVGRLALAGVLAWGALTPTLTLPAQAATMISVTTTADELTVDGTCSLREAIRAANLDVAVDACPAGSGADTIVLPAGMYQLSLGGRNDDAALSGDLDLAGSLSIVGDGAASTSIVGSGDRVLDVLAGASVQISGVTITGGSLPFGNGAGIRNAGSLSLTNAHVTGNGVNLPIPVFACPVEEFPDCPAEGFAFGSGMGIFSRGTLTVVSSTISNNRPNVIEPVVFGGGIDGSATLINSTVSGNAAFFGGGLSTGPFIIISSTIVNNQSDSPTEGVLGEATMRNSIVAGNRGQQGFPSDCRSVISQGFNLIGTVGFVGGVGECSVTGDLTGNLTGRTIITETGPLGATGLADPRLGPLQINGGQVPTHALLTGSPAIDAGNPAAPGSTPTACPTIDQRGVPRPQDGNGDRVAVCDIGAFELQPIRGTQPPNAVPPSRAATVPTDQRETPMLPDQDFGAADDAE